MLFDQQLGRRIVKKCGGLPLALKVIGGFLQNELKEQTWNDVFNNNLWDPKEIILSALRISYNHLPSYLKPCFLYASLFPKDHYFEKLELIRMWIDQGYIQLTERKCLWEDIAVEYFEDLVRRSFFQCSKHKQFVLHDMVHDLAQSITRNEICSSLDFDELKNFPQNAKHVFIKDAKFDQVIPHGNIRTLYIHELDLFSAAVHYQNFCSKIVFSHLSCLRVLRFYAPYFKCSFECINSIGYLQQLRYLSICAVEIHMTEHSLCSLYKLQTLILQSEFISMPPHAMGKLISLRHLMISARCNLVAVPQSYFGRKNLLSFRFKQKGYEFLGSAREELFESTFDVIRDDPYSNIRWLKPLTNLQKCLKLYRLENFFDREDAKSANLQSKPYVESLSLIWKCRKYDKCARNDKAILEGLQPHTNIKELTIKGYNSSSFPSWFGNPHFSNLTKIRLRKFYNNEECKFLHLSKLPSLTSLKIKVNEGITRIGQDFWCYNFPPDWHENYSIEAHMDFLSFEYQTHKSLHEWKERPMERNGDFLSLKCLHLINCHKLQLISNLPSRLETIYVRSCESLEYIKLPYSSRHLFRLQKVKIHHCHNLKSVINLNNLLGTLKLLKLDSCYRLRPDLDEEFDHSFRRVSFEEGFALVIECPRMREWCQWHGFTYEEESDDSSSEEVSDDSSSDISDEEYSM
ncbi:putative disease resistance RPP13-like protein 1 [Dendrobium catenatum]|uniref:putative disease resistance RPP13-like protein 1 n=1 Tax=Dendrobium catenatum TaxID=906689 RepID=UPI0009F34D8B|nr:putative disease resistance RPP13-like protein 1 [Dendrobium catenatum]